MIINLPYDNVEMMKVHHEKMKSWNEDMAKQHESAAQWHKAQVEELEKAMIRVPLEPQEVATPSSGSPSGSDTGEDLSGSNPVQEVPLDPVKKSDLISILNDHVDEYGEFSKPVEQIVESIFGK